MAPKLLAGLNAVPWDSLEDAFGEATEIPKLLTEVADSQGELEGGDAWMELTERLVDEDGAYSAAEAAVPFLFELLDWFGRDRGYHGILSLMDRIAGYGDEHEDDELLRSRRAFEKLDEADKRSPCIGDRCERAVRNVVPGLFRFLEDPDPHVRADAAQLLSRFPDISRLQLSAWESAIVRESHHWAAVQLLRAYIVISEPDNAAGARFLRKVFLDLPEQARPLAALVLVDEAGDGSETAWLAAMAQAIATTDGILSLTIRGMLYSARDVSAHRVIDVLLDVFSGIQAERRAFDVMEGLIWLAFRDRCGYPSRGAERRVLVEVAPPALPREAVFRHLGGNRWEHRVAMATAQRMTDTDPPPVPMDFAPRVESGADLNPVQRRVIHSLCNHDALWCVGSDLLGVYGLPVARAELGALIAPSAPA